MSPPSRSLPPDLDPDVRKELQSLLVASRRSGDEKQLRRVRTVLAVLKGKRIGALAAELGITRGAIDHWLQALRKDGPQGLLSRPAPGARRRLDDRQLEELKAVLTLEPRTAGLPHPRWSYPAIQTLIHARFGVSYHPNHIPRVLRRMGL
jgi:transposase